MANQLYPYGKQALLEAAINWGSDTIKVALVKSTYTPNFSTDRYLSDLGSNRVGTDQTLAGKTSALGVADANDPSWLAVTTGNTVTYLVIYKDTGVAGTSPLIACLDTATGSPGLPLTTNGGDVALTFDNGANKIFKL